MYILTLYIICHKSVNLLCEVLKLNCRFMSLLEVQSGKISNSTSTKSSLGVSTISKSSLPDLGVDKE